MVDFLLALHRVVEASQEVVEITFTGDHSQVTTTLGVLPVVAMVEVPTVDSVDQLAVVTAGLATRSEEALAAAALGVQEVLGVLGGMMGRRK